MSKKIGLPPGTLTHIGEKKLERTRISLIDYDEAQFQEKELKTVEECLPFKDTPTITWMNINGLHDVGVINRIGDHFNIHPLVLEDILNTEQHPKYQDFDNHLFIVVKALHYDEKDDQIKAEQVSLILGKNFVISFQENEKDLLNPIRERIRNGKGRVRKMGADYLFYALLDTIIDNYFIILEKLDERIEALEEDVMNHPKPETLEEIHYLKREMIFLRKSLWPLREVISSLEREDSPIIQEKTRIYLRDVYEHTIQVIETAETMRDVVSGMLDIYLSNASNRMNEIMKVLTIIATIFIPLTFITGIYGMNFKFMPELEWKGGYFIVLALMAVIGVSMLVYFKRKKWF